MAISVTVSINELNKELFAAAATAHKTVRYSRRRGTKRQKVSNNKEKRETVLLSRNEIELAIVEDPEKDWILTHNSAEIPVQLELSTSPGSSQSWLLSLSHTVYNETEELLVLKLDPDLLPSELCRNIRWSSLIISHFPRASDYDPFSTTSTLVLRPGGISLAVTLTALCYNAPTPASITTATKNPWWRLLAESFPANAPVLEESQKATPKDFYASCYTPPRTRDVTEDVQHPILECTLLPYQRRTVQWMLDRERGGIVPNYKVPPTFFAERDASGAECYVSHVFGIVSRDLEALWSALELPRGGLLAEEMGLGKTVEMIALMALHTMPKSMATEVNDSHRCIGGTLIITPPSILEQWKSEIAVHAPSVKVCHYQGMKQHLNLSTDAIVQMFFDADVVLTTYTVLSHELHYLEAKDWSRRLSRTKRYEARRSPLGELTWWRVCVDEAQMIDGGLSNASVVAQQIHRVNSWAVTGTPIRKEINDVHGLLRFLRYTPFDQKNPSLFSVMVRFNKNAFQAVVGAVALRHTKDAVSDEIRLPLQKRVVVKIPFSTIEYQNYRHLFQQMCDECRITDERRNEGDLQPEVVERLRKWLTRLRQTCLHPQAGERNRRVFGGMKAPLRTVDEVLELMADAHAVALRNDERALFESKIRRGHMLEIGEDYEGALGVWMRVLGEVREVVKECRAALEEEQNPKVQEAVEEPAEWLEEDDEAAEGDSKIEVGRNGTLRNRLRNILELEHACLFWVGTAWYQLKCKKEEADAESEELPQLREKEEEYYEAAKLVRKEMLHETRGRVLKLLKLLRTRADTNRFIPIPDIPECNPNCGIETQSIIYDIGDIAAALNSQAGLIEQWRIQLVQLLAQPLIDEETPESDRGDEFEASVSDQELSERMMTGIRVLLADRAEALTGEENNALIKHDIQTDMAREGLHQELFKELMLERDAVGVHALEQVRFRSLKAGMVELRAKVAGFRGGGERMGMQRILVEQELKILAETVTKQTDVLKKISGEIIFFRKVMNARKEFYSQMQAISDTVAPFDPEEVFWRGVRINEALFQKLLIEERVLAERVTKAKSKLRYLVHLKGKGVEEEQECLICKETYEIGILTSCGHSYCKECMVEWYKGSHKCPACSGTLNLKDMYQISYRPKEATMHEEHIVSSSSASAVPTIYSGMDKAIMDEIKRIEIKYHYGSKIDMIIRHLLWLRTNEPTFKAVLFSQWSDFLDFLKTVLTHSNLGFASLDHRGLKIFRSDPSCHIFLLHAKSQSAGLSLVHATHVFLCEPLLNVSLELQAVSRVHRIGQKRPTTVWLYVVEGTVEENVWRMATGRRLALMQKAAAEDVEMGTSGEDLSAGPPSSTSEEERRLDVANSVEMQRGEQLVERGVGGGEVVGAKDVWECIFGVEKRKKETEGDVVRREMLAWAAERRMRT